MKRVGACGLPGRVMGPPGGPGHTLETAVFDAAGGAGMNEAQSFILSVTIRWGSLATDNENPSQDGADTPRPDCECGKTQGLESTPGVQFSGLSPFPPGAHLLHLSLAGVHPPRLKLRAC